MSRKKCPTNENSLGGRLRIYREARGDVQVKFANILKISHGSLSEIENNKTKPSSVPIQNLIQNTDINIYWLYKGVGKMTIGKDDNYLKTPNESPEILELLELTKSILNSKSTYANSLRADIQAFHHSLQIENEIADIRSIIANDRRQERERRQKERDSSSGAIEHRSGKDRRSRGGA